MLWQWKRVVVKRRSYSFARKIPQHPASQADTGRGCSECLQDCRESIQREVRSRLQECILAKPGHCHLLSKDFESSVHEVLQVLPVEC